MSKEYGVRPAHMACQGHDDFRGNAEKASAQIDPSAAPPPPSKPPPRRLTVVEAPMDRLANPVTGYANLGRPRSVSSSLTQRTEISAAPLLSKLEHVA